MTTNNHPQTVTTQPRLSVVAQNKTIIAARRKDHERTFSMMPKLRHDAVTAMLRGMEPKTAQSEYCTTQPLLVWLWAQAKFNAQEKRISMLEDALRMGPTPVARRMAA